MSEKKVTELRPTRLNNLLGQAATFPLDVEITKLDGSTALVNIIFKAHGKRAWSAIKDAHDNLIPTVDADTPVLEDAPAKRLTLADITDKGIRTDVAMILKIASGWDLEEPFDVESLVNMEDTFGGSSRAIVTAYDRAIYQGQLGNF
jgi:hypothetical protein